MSYRFPGGLDLRWVDICTGVRVGVVVGARFTVLLAVLLACTASACDKGSTGIDATVCDGALGCGSCGERGNELGVGRYCTPNGDECLDTDALLCTIWYEPSAPPFCTMPCERDKDCGTNAYCGTNPDKPSQRGCTPYVCGRPPDAGFGDAGLADATLLDAML